MKKAEIPSKNIVKMYTSLIQLIKQFLFINKIIKLYIYQIFIKFLFRIKISK